MSKDIHFSRLLGIQREQHGGRMQLAFSDDVQNHVGSMHASAQFALAEIGSGDLMRQRFPELADKVLAVVRRAEIKYSKAASESLTAYPSINDEDADKLLKRLESKGNGLLSVDVKLKTVAGETVTHAVYHWFVTKL